MNRVEPVMHDVDLVDARVMDKMAAIDWRKLEEKESASFGLVLGLYRDAVHSADERRVACGTAAGGVIAISVLCALAIALGASAGFVALLIIGHQTARTAILWFKWRKANKYAAQVEDELVDVAQELGKAHPLT